MEEDVSYPMPSHVEAWVRCHLLHSKRPIYTGKKIWIEVIKEYREEIIWVCDVCKQVENEKET